MQKIETNFLRTKRAKLGRNDFHVIKRIGNGAYGVVNLVRKKNDPASQRGCRGLHDGQEGGVYGQVR